MLIQQDRHNPVCAKLAQMIVIAVKGAAVQLDAAELVTQNLRRTRKRYTKFPTRCSQNRVRAGVAVIKLFPCRRRSQFGSKRDAARDCIGNIEPYLRYRSNNKNINTLAL